jgi:hypothetical protein
MLDIGKTRALFWLHSDVQWPSNTRLVNREVRLLKQHRCMNDNTSMSFWPLARTRFKRSKDRQPEAGLAGRFPLRACHSTTSLIITQCKEGHSRKDCPAISNAEELRSRPFPEACRTTGNVADHIRPDLGESRPSMVTSDLSMRVMTQKGSFRCRFLLDAVL